MDNENFKNNENEILIYRKPCIDLVEFGYAPDSTDLNGKWVDVNTKTDTMTFETHDKRSYIILARGKEIKSGHASPKSCLGLYTYELLPGDKISLSWFYSSIQGTKDYHFKQAGSVIEVEEFYCMKKTGTILTFKKLN